MKQKASAEHPVADRRAARSEVEVIESESVSEDGVREGTAGKAPATGSRVRRAEATLARALLAAQQRTGGRRGRFDLDAEIVALVATLSDRDRDVVLSRWGMNGWPPPLFRALASRYGVSPVRVREILTRHEERLSRIRPVLILAPRAADLLTAEGGTLSTAAYIAALGAVGVSATTGALHALAALGGLNLVAKVHRHGASGLWLDEVRHAEESANGALDRATRELLARGRFALRRTGFVTRARLASSPPITAAHATELIFGGAATKAVGACVVPLVQVDSLLTTHVARMLAVTPRMAISDLARGLRRLPPKPIRVSPPVLTAVLSRHPAFFVRAGAARLRTPAARRAVLRPAEVDVVEFMERRGGYAIVHEIQAVLAARGHSSGWFVRIAMEPYLVPLGGSRYALRGWPLPHGSAEVPDHARGRPVDKERVLAGVRWDGPTRATLRYLVSPTTRRGALRLPRAVTGAVQPVEGEWPVRLVRSGASARVARARKVGRLVGRAWVRTGMLWDLSACIAQLDVADGEHVEVTLDVGRREITVARAPAGAPARRRTGAGGSA